jgi:hypothetical protein
MVRRREASMSSARNERPAFPVAAESNRELRAVAEALERLRYGVIQLTVHDGKLTQLDVTERQRFC